MNRREENLSTPWLLRAETWFIFWLFLLLSGARSWHPVLAASKIEIPVLLMFFLSLFMKWKNATTQVITPVYRGWLVWLGLSALIPLMAAFGADGELEVLINPAYLTMLKMVCIMGALPLAFDHQSMKAALGKGLFLQIILTAGVILYKMYVLNELSLDGRPQLVGMQTNDANYIATLMAFGVPWGFFAWQTAASPRAKGGALIGTGLLMAVILVTQSRMGLLALFAAVATSLVFAASSFKKAVLASLVILGLGLSVAGIGWIAFEGKVPERFTRLNDMSNQNRLVSWKAGLLAFEEEPIWGVGFNKSKDYYYKAGPHMAFFSEGKSHETHNVFLMSLAESGVIGFAILMLFWIALVGADFRLLKQHRLFASACLGSAISLLANAMTLPMNHKQFYLALMGILACMVISPFTKTDERILLQTEKGAAA